MASWSPMRRNALAALLAVAVLTGAIAVAAGWPAPARAGVVAALCLLFWLTEWVPTWVPTLILWIAVPVLLGSFGPAYRPASVLAWSADPVLMMFLCGFALAAAARRWGLDVWLVAYAVRLSRGEPGRLVVLAACTTVGLSMWMSNVAAAALVFGALRPVLQADAATPAFRRALLLAVAFSADVGGVATPIGSGPNGIAMAAVRRTQRIDFLDWMVFGVPLALALAAAVVVMIHLRLRPGECHGPLGQRLPAPGPLRPRAWVVCALVACTVGLWLTERLHGWPAWTVALGAVIAMPALGLLGPRDVRHIDWGTLLLVAGGIGLGTLFRSPRPWTRRHRRPF